ncbi:MAG: hypothetical protein JRG73_18335, partial [Deltaproteobacteria bacterium]|nr:hypothetical protein [Deltaproteobacteria bacterium]MBW2308885.1 hypothetical protein [Deltaproteobacteria bacterium]
MFKKALSVLAVAVFIMASFVSVEAYEALKGPTGVIQYNPDKAFNGYTLFDSNQSTTSVYLIDMEGYIVHKWDTDYRAGLHSHLLPNGNLLRGGTLPNGIRPVHFGGTSGIVQEFDWDGNVVWEYRNSTPTTVQHHTFARMPNGNT